MRTCHATYAHNVHSARQKNEFIFGNRVHIRPICLFESTSAWAIQHTEVAHRTIEHQTRQTTTTARQTDVQETANTSLHPYYIRPIDHESQKPWARLLCCHTCIGFSLFMHLPPRPLSFSLLLSITHISFINYNPR